MIVTQDDGINARLVLRFPLRRLLLVVLTLADGHALCSASASRHAVLLRAMSQNGSQTAECSALASSAGTLVPTA
jgi:hypothetical protein